MIVWCEDCKFCRDADMGGEGWCEVYDKYTRYGCDATDCPYFKRTEPPKEESK